MLRPRRNWTRGVAAQHASLSRWRSPVRIRSGPPSLRISLRPVRPPGRGVLLSRAVRGGGRTAPRRPVEPTSVTLRPVKGRPFPVLLGLLLVALVTVLAVVQLGIIGGASGSAPSPSEGSRVIGASAPPASADGASPSPAPSQGAAATSSPSSPAPATPGPIADVLDRPGHELPGDPHGDDPRRARGRAGRPEHPLRRARARVGRGRRDPRGAQGRSPERHGSPRPRSGRDGPRRGPHQERQAARVPARRRGRSGGPCAGVGRQGAVRRRPRQGDEGLAADRATPRSGPGRGLRPGHHLDPVRGWRHHARPRRLPDPRAQGQGRRLPVRWRDGRHHRSGLLLVVRLGGAPDAADR